MNEQHRNGKCGVDVIDYSYELNSLVHRKLSERWHQMRALDHTKNWKWVRENSISRHLKQIVNLL